jgi:hypothetical protein
MIVVIFLLIPDLNVRIGKTTSKTYPKELRPHGSFKKDDENTCGSRPIEHQTN